jgi:hypothetical protein
MCSSSSYRDAIRKAFRQCLTGFIHIPVAFYRLGRIRTAQPAANASEAQYLAANKGTPPVLKLG